MRSRSRLGDQGQPLPPPNDRSVLFGQSKQAPSTFRGGLDQLQNAAAISADVFAASKYQFKSGCLNGVRRMCSTVKPALTQSSLHCPGGERLLELAKPPAQVLQINIAQPIRFLRRDQFIEHFWNGFFRQVLLIKLHEEFGRLDDVRVAQDAERFDETHDGHLQRHASRLEHLDGARVRHAILAFQFQHIQFTPRKLYRRCLGISESFLVIRVSPTNALVPEIIAQRELIGAIGRSAVIFDDGMSSFDDLRPTPW